MRFNTFKKSAKQSKSTNTQLSTSKIETEILIPFQLKDNVDMNRISKLIDELKEREHWQESREIRKRGLSLSRTEARLKLHMDAIVDETKVIVQNGKSTYLRLLALAKDAVKGFNKEEFAKFWYQTSGIHAKISKYDEKSRAKKAELERLSVQKKKLEDSLKLIIKNRKDDKPLEKSWENKKGIMFFLYGFLGIVEGIITFLSVQIITGGNNLACIAISIVATFGLFISSHLTGKAIAKGFKKQRNIYVGIALAILGWITVLRISAEMGHFLTTFNVILVMLSVVLSYLHERDADYFKLKEDISNIVLEIDLIESEIKSIKKNKEDEIFEYTTKAEKAATKEEKKLNTTVTNYEMICEEFDNYLSQVIESLNTVSISIILNQIRPGWAFGNEFAENDVLDIKEEPLPKYSSNGKVLKSIIVILAFFSLTSCSKPDIKVVGGAIDITDIQTINSNVYTDNILEEVDYTSNGIFTHGIEIWLSIITDQRFSPTIKISLPPAKPYLLRSEKNRKALQEKMEISLRTTIDSLFKLSKPLEESYVLRGINASIQGLKSSGYTQFNVIIASDMMQNSNDKTGLSFYDYKYNPEGLLNNYENEKTKLEPIQTSDFSNVSLIIYHRPIKAYDALFENGLIFWQRYFKDIGGHEVHFSSSHTISI